MERNFIFDLTTGMRRAILLMKMIIIINNRGAHARTA